MERTAARYLILILGLCCLLNTAHCADADNEDSVEEDYENIENEESEEAEDDNEDESDSVSLEESESFLSSRDFRVR